MNWLKAWLDENVHKLVGSSSLISIVQFLYQLYGALSDGQLTWSEVDQLMASANGLNSIILLAVYAYLKVRKG